MQDFKVGDFVLIIKPLASWIEYKNTIQILKKYDSGARLWETEDGVPFVESEMVVVGNLSVIEKLVYNI